MNKKRVAVFVFYDKDGIVDRYVIYLLRELIKVTDRLIVVCNGELTGDGRRALNDLTDELLIRENSGFDAWGFKAGLEYIGKDSLDKYDELILMNDSVFGPIYPFGEMFDEMERKGADFWGITKHGQLIDATGSKKKQVFPEHIQSYFYVIGKRMFLHTEFTKYWENLRKFASWKEVVSLHEARFTKHFAEKGFTWDVYVNTDKEFSEYSDVSQIMQMAYELIKNYKCPVLKRKNFSIDYGNFFAFSAGDTTRKAFDYIHEKTNYYTELIWEHILRTMSLRYITDNLNLNYVLPDKYLKDASLNIDSVKVALFAHITYEDQIEFCMEYISSALDFADIYITTLSERVKVRLTERFSIVTHKKLSITVLPENRRGRDVGALWVGLKPYMQEYDYVCFVHNKKSSQDKPLTIGRGFAQRCLENTLSSKEYVKNIIGTFASNPRLGLLFPPPVIHGPYTAIISNLWGGNYENTVALAKKLGIDVPIIIDIDPIFPTGGMFWFRPKALKKLIAYDWTYEDFQSEPLPVDGTLGHAFERVYGFAAQSEGYYSAWVLNDYFVSTEITSLSYILASVKFSGWRLYFYKLVVFLKRYQRLYLFLRSMYRFFRKAVGK